MLFVLRTTADPEQVLRAVLSEREYTLRLLWNERHRYWTLRISDSTGDPIAITKIVEQFSLFRGVRDARMPPGLFFAMRAGLEDLELVYAEGSPP